MGEQVCPVEMEELDYDFSNSKPFSTIGSSVIPILNKLQDIFLPLSSGFPKIHLPQVAVVGSQSSGKSSVLEALVGRDFLPRGCDICTRRPLVLQLENRPSKSDEDDRREWGEFRHLPGKRFYDFNDIRREIQAETEREAGINKGLSDKQIRLKISSPNVLHITLVDLPGITKVPVGDQPSDIEARIRTIIMSYIKQETCIILAVSPANSGLTNSDALDMARNADPAGLRTIGVITKLDIMDRGTNACNFLLGKVVPLRLGYVGVVNRSQEDINKNRSIAEALSFEKHFFRDHSVYHGLADHCGIPQLAKKLNQILEQHIRMILPGLKAELNCQLVAAAKELQAYGDAMESKAEREKLVLKILTEYCEAFTKMIDGKSEEFSIKELSGGARIHYIFQSIFVKTLEEVDPCENLTDEEIRIAIQNATGVKHSLFVPEIPFEVLIKRQIARLAEPSLQCLRFVYDELIKMSRVCETINLQRFPVLRMHLGEVVGAFLRDGLEPAEGMILNMINMEANYINSSHPKFIGGSKAVEQAIQQLRVSKDYLQDYVDAEGSPPSETGQKSRSVVAKPIMNSVLPDQGGPSQVNGDRPLSNANSSTWSWGISAIFGSRSSSGQSLTRKSLEEAASDCDHTPSTIQLREPPKVLRPLEVHTENEVIAIIVTKLLLRSYFDIVRKNIQDFVPKAIIEDLFDEMLQEQDEVVLRKKRNREMLNALQQAVQVLEEIEYDVSSQNLTASLGINTTTGLPRIPGFSSTPYSNIVSRSYFPSSNSNVHRKVSDHLLRGVERQSSLFTDKKRFNRQAIGIVPRNNIVKWMYWLAIYQEFVVFKAIAVEQAYTPAKHKEVESRKNAFHCF
ncbi:Dynamin, N-terminal [Dillenia turbinata]|uniref:Dynamin, N-terminal n=1 Tax=Dillenia turbinata TaxID=194707 RepID=A0AAN8Z7G4_9MAGN